MVNFEFISKWVLQDSIHGCRIVNTERVSPEVLCSGIWWVHNAQIRNNELRPRPGVYIPLGLALNLFFLLSGDVVLATLAFPVFPSSFSTFSMICGHWLSIFLSHLPGATNMFIPRTLSSAAETSIATSSHSFNPSSSSSGLIRSRQSSDNRTTLAESTTSTSYLTTVSHSFPPTSTKKVESGSENDPSKVASATAAASRTSGSSLSSVKQSVLTKLT